MKRRGPVHPNPAVLRKRISVALAATAAAAVFTTSAATAAATRAVFARTGDIDGEGAAADVLAVQGINGLLRLLGRAHGHEAKAAGAAGHAVHHQVGLDHRAVRRKGVLEVIFGGVEREVSDKQFIFHLSLLSDKPVLSADCSPNFGSEIFTELSSPEDLPSLENDKPSNSGGQPDGSRPEGNKYRQLSFAPKTRRAGKLSFVIGPSRPMLPSMEPISWRRRWFSRPRPLSQLESTRAAAEAGDAAAQFALGLRLSTGDEAARNPDQAAGWFRKAAEQDHVPAQFSLGMMLAGGYGVPRDDVASLKLTRRAAEGGDAGAQHHLGSSLHRASMERGRPDALESRIEAYKWFHLAADQGCRDSAAACERLAMRMTREQVLDGDQRAAAFVVRKPARPSAAAEE